MWLHTWSTHCTYRRGMDRLLCQLRALVACCRDLLMLDDGVPLEYRGIPGFSDVLRVSVCCSACVHTMTYNVYSDRMLGSCCMASGPLSTQVACNVYIPRILAKMNWLLEACMCTRYCLPKNIARAGVEACHIVLFVQGWWATRAWTFCGKAGVCYIYMCSPRGVNVLSICTRYRRLQAVSNPKIGHRTGIVVLIM